MAKKLTNKKPISKFFVIFGACFLLVALGTLGYYVYSGGTFESRSSASDKTPWQNLKQIIWSEDGKRLWTRTCWFTKSGGPNWSNCDPWTEVKNPSNASETSIYKAGLPVNPEEYPFENIGTYTYWQNGVQYYKRTALGSNGTKLWTNTYTINNTSGPIWSSNTGMVEVTGFPANLSQMGIKSAKSYSFYEYPTTISGSEQVIKSFVVGNIDATTNSTLYNFVKQNKTLLYPNSTIPSQISAVFTRTCPVNKTSGPNWSKCTTFKMVDTSQLTLWYKETKATNYSSFGAYGYYDGSQFKIREVLTGYDSNGTNKMWGRNCNSNNYGATGCTAWTEVNLVSWKKTLGYSGNIKGYETYTFETSVPYHITNTTDGTL